jgi:eukaryotic-like serine/threonine-protein kinase
MGSDRAPGRLQSTPDSPDRYPFGQIRMSAIALGRCSPGLRAEFRTNSTCDGKLRARTLQFYGDDMKVSMRLGYWIAEALAWVAIPIASAQEATMFRGNPLHSGVYATNAPTNLSLKWKFQTGGPVVSSPAVLDGTVFIGSADKNVYALDTATGKLRWKFDAHADVNSSPAVGKGIVYVLSLDGNLYAVDAKTGTQRWSFATEGERRFAARSLFGMMPRGEFMPDPWDLFVSSPVVANGTVFFGSGDGHIYALDADTGKLRWKFKTGDVVHSSPAVSDGVVYFGSWDSYFYALSAADGSVVWKYKTGEDLDSHLMTGIQGSPAIADGTVYFGCRDANLYALDAKTGSLKWKYATSGSWVVSSPAVSDDVVYFATSDSDKFIALDARTGRLLYDLPTHIYAFSSVAIAGSHAYFGTFDGKLHDIDLKRRTQTGEFATPGYRKYGGTYLKSNGDLNQEEVWKGDTVEDQIGDLHGKVFSMGSILSSPAVEKGIVYVASVDGSVYALGKSTK